MTSIFIGSFLISLLHAVIPNHWLPVLAIGRKEGWNLAETSRITFIAGMAHVLSTIIIGILLGMIGGELTQHIDDFANVIAPSILILIGLFLYDNITNIIIFMWKKDKLKRKQKEQLFLHWLLQCFFLPVWK